MKKAIITGITGQDGAYLAEFLLNKDYIVYGTYRRTSSVNFWRIQDLGIEKNKNLHLVEYDLTDQGSSLNLINTIKPDEVYNLAAQSFVGVSFDQPTTTAQINAFGPLNLLEAIKSVDREIKFYQASTSEMFGKVQSIPQTELTPFYPRSPYGVSKLYAHWLTINYRESYDIFACSGILFNHESPLRGKEFVTRKISDTVAKIYLKQADELSLGNLDAKRDWGFAREYVEGMWKMLQINKPETYILATNKTTSVRDFVKLAFEAVDIEIKFEGVGAQEIGFDEKTGRKLVHVNPNYYRPAEVDLLIGDYDKAKKDLGWEPNVDLLELCKLMVDADIKRNKLGMSF